MVPLGCFCSAFIGVLPVLKLGQNSNYPLLVWPLKLTKQPHLHLSILLLTNKMLYWNVIDRSRMSWLMEFELRF